MYGTPEKNLFASRLKAKLSVYCSFQADPFSTYVDAFSIDWGRFSLSYLFPPFSLLARLDLMRSVFVCSPRQKNKKKIYFFSVNT